MANRKTWSEEEGKVCSKCAVGKPLTDFRPRVERSGYRSKCIPCETVSHREWAERNPGRSRDRNLKSKYGIGASEYLVMLDAQDGRCAICGSTESGWSTSPFLHVDHNHGTGAVRGLLCHQCNIGVGLVENGMPIDQLRAYLEIWST